jgi:hypothetical protein
VEARDAVQPTLKPACLIIYKVAKITGYAIDIANLTSYIINNQMKTPLQKNLVFNKPLPTSTSRQKRIFTMEFTQVLNWLIVGIPCVFCALFVVDFVIGLFKLWDEIAIKNSPISQPINYFPEPTVLPQPHQIPKATKKVAPVVQTEQASPQPRRGGRPKKQAILQDVSDKTVEVATKRRPGRPKKVA